MKPQFPVLETVRFKRFGNHEAVGLVWGYYCKGQMARILYFGKIVKVPTASIIEKAVA